MVVAYVTYGAVSSAMITSAAQAAAGSATLAANTGFAVAGIGMEAGALTTLGGAIAGATSGFAAGLVAGGNFESGLYGALGGGIGGALAGSGMLGQMVGGGVNGYLQTGDARGFARGFAAGAIPADLGFTSAYRSSPGANIGIGIARDGLRGAIVGGRDGIVRGIGYGQFNNALGHLVGVATGSYRGLHDGVFMYEGSFWGYGRALTLGNVAAGPIGMSNPGAMPAGHFGFRDYRQYLEALASHEIGHTTQNYLGALYIPAHLTAMSVSLATTGHTHYGNPLEEGLHPFPFSAVEQAARDYGPLR